MHAMNQDEQPEPGALDEARQRFVEAGLALPSVPAEMRNRIARIEDWVYGTRPDVPSLYDLGWFVREVGMASVADYVMFGHAGHGINSYAMHYYLVRGPLALFLQLSWGGAYESGTEATRAVTARFAEAERLIDAVESADRQGRFAPGERFIVMASDYHGARWRRLQGITDALRLLAPKEWHEGKVNDILLSIPPVLHSPANE
jgi:hypothetical protein